jgi:hypothetical protein
VSGAGQRDGRAEGSGGIGDEMVGAVGGVSVGRVGDNPPCPGPGSGTVRAVDRVGGRCEGGGIGGLAPTLRLAVTREAFGVWAGRCA